MGLENWEEIQESGGTETAGDFPAVSDLYLWKRLRIDDDDDLSILSNQLKYRSSRVKVMALIGPEPKDVNL